EHRLLALDRALLAREPRDVAREAAVRSLGIDEGPAALVGAEVTGGALVVLGRELERERGLDADEARGPGPLVATQGLHRRADGPGLTGVRVDVDLGVGHPLLDVVDLGLDRGEAVLGAALQHE